MGEFFSLLWQHAFLQHAALAGILAAIACGVIGSFVVVKQIGFLAGGMAHSVLGGIGAALYFGLNASIAALLAAVAAALIIGLITLHWKENEDTLIAALWAVGMALGIVFIAKTPGYNTELMNYLFGNILMVSQSELWGMLVLDAILLTTVALLYKQLLAVSFDEEFARLRGLPVTFFYLILLVLVAVTVVLLIQVVGLILVIALLTLPAAIAAQYTRTLSAMMALATLLGLIFTLGGLGLSFQPDLPSGPVIILLAGAAYLCSTLLSRLALKVRSKRIRFNNQT